jgi:hypothetical protein
MLFGLANAPLQLRAPSEKDASRQLQAVVGRQSVTYQPDRSSYLFGETSFDAIDLNFINSLFISTGILTLTN